MRISDWSSDVCSFDLGGDARVRDRRTQLRVRAVDGVRCGEDDVVPGRTVVHVERDLDRDPGAVGGYSHRGDGGDAAGLGAVRGPGERARPRPIGRASGRERVFTYV